MPLPNITPEPILSLTALYGPTSTHLLSPNIGKLAKNIYSNIVGYTTYECTAGKWYLISAMFEKTGGGDVNLQDLIKGDSRLVPGADALDESSPLIQYWNPTKNGVGGYEMFYFLTKAYDSKYKSYNNVWSKGKQGYTADSFVPAGYGFWIYGTKAMFGDKDSIDINFSL